MNLTLDYLKSSRKWLVPNLTVWGNAESCETALLLTEQNGSSRVIFTYSLIGGEDQVIDFADLHDSRGNVLPSEIINPVVIVIPRNEAHCFIVGRPSSANFKIAFDPDSVTNMTNRGLVDLLIMEIDLP
jgi:hypothetical protein